MKERDVFKGPKSSLGISLLHASIVILLLTRNSERFSSLYLNFFFAAVTSGCWLVRKIPFAYLTQVGFGSSPFSCSSTIQTMPNFHRPSFWPQSFAYTCAHRSTAYCYVAIKFSKLPEDRQPQGWVRNETLLPSDTS